MTPQHFYDIQSRRDFFRNCAGGIGRTSIGVSLIFPSIFVASCTMSNGPMTGMEASNLGRATALPLKDDSSRAVITRILDNMAPKDRKSIVVKETINFDSHTFYNAKEIRRTLIDELHVSGYDALPLIDSFVNANRDAYRIDIESEPAKQYEIGEWIGFDLYDKGYCCIRLSLPVMDSANYIGLVDLEICCGPLDGGGAITAFRFNEDKLEILANVPLWIS